MDFKLVSKHVITVIAGTVFATAAIAQWQWTDRDGRRVFSDRSPPPEVLDKDILKRPSGSLRAASTDATLPAGTLVKPAAAASAPAARASAPKLSGKDAELEAKKKQAEEQAAAKQKAEEEKQAGVKAENCERAKSGLATLKSGVRIAGMNAKGEQEVFDDARRAAETKRTQEIIDSNCK
jgi:hypothetical protein